MATTQDADAAIKYTPTPDGLGDFEIPDAYKDWLADEGVKVIEDFAFDDLSAIELGPWQDARRSRRLHVRARRRLACRARA